MEERKIDFTKTARGKFCGYFGPNEVYYSRPHFCLAGNGRRFIRFLSQREAKDIGLRESPNNTSAKIFGKTGYIGPNRHKGKSIRQPDKSVWQPDKAEKHNPSLTDEL